MTERRSQSQPLVFIETYGCQMNKCDSEIVMGILGSDGFQSADSPDEADIILVNTCSVRDHAEQRALGRISTLAGWKRAKKDRKLGIIGCMAQRLGKELLEMKPFVDIVAGPDDYSDLPAMLASDKAICKSELDHQELYQDVLPRRSASFHAWVTIIRGCDNFCSYCIVPHTRGRERSRSPQLIYNEIRELTGKGFTEFTLLGQNVNSYMADSISFPELLDRAASQPGVARMRFMTSHPKDLSDNLIDVIAENPQVCEHIHLPLQAGSDRILHLMDRKYTRDEYYQLVNRIRTKIPGVALTTDIMVGFPGETEADFDFTRDMIETIRYDDAFTYYFSPRSGTPAADMENQIEKEIKLGRLNRLIELQRKISLEIRQSMIGRVVEAVPEFTSKQSDDEWMGKTRTNHVIVFPKTNTSPGERINVKIESCSGSTLRGIVVNNSNIIKITRREICG